ncbi:MAG: radical SAM protein [Elusimicrobia bacterium]|nr:radical SAM protein [Elusimicrobiota bacterium]MDE2426928.1 radical SAM protein [Elusimicrobiota bacterium]
MPDGVRTYRKHDSFVALKQRTPLPDPKPRLQALLERGGDRGLDARKAQLARRAARELLGLERPDQAEPFQLHANVQEELARLDDSELPRYLFYRYRYETYPQRKLLDAWPPCVQIEPTSACNFRCVFCYQTDAEFTRKSNGHMGMMSLDLFKEIVDQIKGEVEAVTLASRGEPLICPDLERMLAYAGGKFLALKINTNASLLTEAKCHAILASGPSTVVFSADAASEPAYSRLRVGGSLEKVLANVRMFAEIKARRYPRSRAITRVSGVKVEGSGNLGQMERLWGDFVDQVAFVSYNPWENAYTAAPTGVEAPCSDLWRRLFVWWDGRVNPCDVDFKSTLSVGSFKSSEIPELWRSEAYERLRADHLEKKRSGLPLCSRCAVI